MQVNAIASVQIASVPKDPVRVWSDTLLSLVDAWRHCLIGATCLTFLAAFNGQWRIEPDSALYLSLARSIATSNGYIYHDHPNAEAYPGLPYLFAGLYKIAPASHRGMLSLLPENLAMLAIALATLTLVYRLFKLHCGRPTAVIIVCGVGLTRTFFRSSFALMTDMPFLFGVMAFLAGYESLMQVRPWSRWRWADLALMAAGMAMTIAMRPAWLAFMPIALVAIAIALIRKRLPINIAVIAAGIAALCIAAFLLLDPRQAAGRFRIERYEDQVLFQLQHLQSRQILDHAWSNIVDLVGQYTTSTLFGVKFGSAFDGVTKLHWYDSLGALAMIASTLFVLWIAMGLFARRALWGLWVSSTLGMMILVLPLERYFLQILPLLVFCWWTGLCWINRKIGGRTGNWVFGLLLAAGIVPNLLQVGAILIEQRQIPFYDHYKGGRYVSTLAIARQIRSSNVPPDAVLLAPDKSARILTYLSHHTVVEQNELILDVGWPISGRPIYIVDDHSDVSFQKWLNDDLRVGTSIEAPNPLQIATGGMKLRQILQTPR